MLPYIIGAIIGILIGGVAGAVVGWNRRKSSAEREIGSAEEADRIRLQKNSGTVFIASVHADSTEAIMKKEYLRKMFEEGVFGYTYLLNRKGGVFSGTFTEYGNNDS